MESHLSSQQSRWFGNCHVPHTVLTTRLTTVETNSRHGPSLQFITEKNTKLINKKKLSLKGAKY